MMFNIFDFCKWRKSVSHPPPSRSRPAGKWCEALFLHLGLLQNPWVGSIWHFRTCNGGSKFLTLDATYFGSGGPISKFQSQGRFILVDLSISTLNFASGPPGIWCEALFLHLGVLQNPWVGSIWHFRTCSGGSKN